MQHTTKSHKNLKCQNCGSIYQSTPALKKHMEEKHSIDEMIDGALFEFDPIN